MYEDDLNLKSGYFSISYITGLDPGQDTKTGTYVYVHPNYSQILCWIKLIELGHNDVLFWDSVIKYLTNQLPSCMEQNRS
jgi:hypothetical protein